MWFKLLLYYLFFYFLQVFVILLQNRVQWFLLRQKRWFHLLNLWIFHAFRLDFFDLCGWTTIIPLFLFLCTSLCFFIIFNYRQLAPNTRWYSYVIRHPWSIGLRLLQQLFVLELVFDFFLSYVVTHFENVEKTRIK